MEERRGRDTEKNSNLNLGSRKCHYDTSVHTALLAIDTDTVVFDELSG